MIEVEAPSVAGYRVERVLGRGGMGVVYEAVQVSLHRRVALKVLRPELAEDATFAARFRREGRIQAAIEHPAVLDVYEVGADAAGRLFLAMRLVPGSTLATLISSRELGAERALDLLGQVGGALDAAHAAGLVHRDVKPGNVLVDGDDHAFLADFGLSRAGTETATTSRPSLGTVAYVAPEVIHGADPTPASDRYAFAATLFHCLTGDVVFPRGSDVAVLYAHASEPPPRASERRPELPAALDRLFEAALAKDPSRRPQSAREIVDAVRETIGPEALAALGPPDRDAAAGRDETAASGPERAALPPQPPRRSPTGVALAAALLLAAGIGAGAALLLAGGDEDDDAQSAAVAVAAVPEGAEALGSDLSVMDGSMDCRGASPPRPAAPPCTLAQRELPGSQVLVPADGLITGWTVRGARGELALDVIRPRGADTVRISRSQWESAGNEAPHRFPTQLAVERGDLIGVQLGRGGSIGFAESEGASADRWLEPVGGIYGRPDDGGNAGTGRELMLRVEFVPGGEPREPEVLTGAAAARAPDGDARRSDMVEISDPAATVRIDLVEVGERVALDLVRDGRRVSRLYLPGLIPEGVPVQMKSFTYEGEPFSEVGIWWVNPSSGRALFHFAHVSAHQIDFVG